MSRRMVRYAWIIVMKDVPELPVASIFFRSVARWMWTTMTPIASVSEQIRCGEKSVETLNHFDRPFLISSPLISRCRSSVKLLGATYSAAAVSSALEMKPEMNGRSMTLGRILLIGTTDIVIRGRPMSVTRVVFTLIHTV